MSDTEEKAVAVEKDERFPLKVTYCGVCGVPPEYCAWSAAPDRCRAWLLEQAPELIQRLGLEDPGTVVAANRTPDVVGAKDEEGNKPEDEDAGGGGEEGAKKHTKRAGKGTKPAGAVPKTKKEPAPAPRVTVQIAPRGKNKSVTVVKGLAGNGVDLKAAAKAMAGHFACGASVTGADEIVVQGDVADTLLDWIPGKFKQIESVDDLGEAKR